MQTLLRLAMENVLASALDGYSLKLDREVSVQTFLHREGWIEEVPVLSSRRRESARRWLFRQDV